MKRFLLSIIVIVAVVFMAGCRNTGSSAPAPSNVKVAEGENTVTITWDMLPGVEYWVFKAVGTNITPESCYVLPQCQIFPKAVSPTVISGLTNGTTYSFTVNGRINGGKGGPGSPSISVTPRLAGASWKVGAPQGSKDLHGIAFSSIFVATGAESTLLTSTDGMAWTPQTDITWLSMTAPATLPDLKAVNYGGLYVTVGSGGILLSSSNAVNWTQQASNITSDLFAVANNGNSVYVATGANGTIINNSNGVSWLPASSIPLGTPALYGVSFGNGMYVAVGAGGTVLTSDALGNTWIPAIAALPLPVNDLKGIAYGPGVSPTGPGTNTTGTFVAVGANGTVVTSTDGGLSWGVPVSSNPIPSTTTINAIAYGTQFVAVGNEGSIYISFDAVNWIPGASDPPNTSAIYAVVRGISSYFAVGAAGLNMYSK